MPIVKTLADRVEKFRGKMVPDTVGARYGAVKELAVGRFLEGTSVIHAVRERTRNILESNGVPAAQHGIYYAFAQMLASAALSHSGATLDAIASGLKAWFTARGCDPAILDLISNLVTGG